MADSEQNARQAAGQEALEPGKRHFLYRWSLPFKHVIKRGLEILTPLVGAAVAGPVGFFAGIYAVGSYELGSGAYQYFNKERHASGLGSALLGAAYLISPYLGMGLSAFDGAYKSFTNKLYPHEVSELKRIDDGNYLTQLGYIRD
jgi:hypothetical protein